VRKIAADAVPWWQAVDGDFAHPTAPIDHGADAAIVDDQRISPSKPPWAEPAAPTTTRPRGCEDTADGDGAVGYKISG
jgi:hypothetical protein